jgi:predicted Zn-dependent protease
VAEVRFLRILAVIGLVPALVVTSVLVRSHKAYRARLAMMWIDRGEDAVKRHDRATAIQDFRSALQLRPDATQDRVRLADLLIDADDVDAAERELLAARQDHPAEGSVNLALARLTALRGDRAGASEYYQAAIRGSWPADANQRETAVAELSVLRARRDPQARRD